MTKVNFDEYSDSYNDLLRESTSFFSDDEKYFARYKAVIARKLVRGEPKKVLEFGCGIGRNIPFLRTQFPEAQVFGSDISATSIDLAREANPGVSFWKEGDEPASAAEFDLIFVAGVFHHVPRPQRDAVARMLFERAAPEARLVVFEHNPYNPVTRRIVRDCPYDADAVLLRPSELRRHLAAAGFEVQKLGYSLFFPPRLGPLVGLERFLHWLPLGGQYWMSGARA